MPEKEHLRGNCQIWPVMFDSIMLGKLVVKVDWPFKMQAVDDGVQDAQHLTGT